jgi:phasin
MTDATTTVTPKKVTVKATTPAGEKVASATFEFPKFEMPKFEFGTPEVPAAFREMAEKSIAQAQANYAKLKASTEEATDLMEDTFETARAGALELNTKSLEAVKANTEAAFSFAKTIVAAKTVAEVVELQTSFMRKYFETLTAQVKDLQETAQKVTADSVAPIKAATEKAMKEFKVA